MANAVECPNPSWEEFNTIATEREKRIRTNGAGARIPTSKVIDRMDESEVNCQH